MTAANYLAGVSAILSLAALAVSMGTFWKTQLSAFRILPAVGPMVMSMYLVDLEGGNKRRALTFSAPLAFANSGARFGRILDIRVKIFYPRVPVEGAFETLLTVGECDPAAYRMPPSGRSPAGDAQIRNLTPFVVLPRETAEKFVLFRGFYNKPIRQTELVVQIEYLTDRNDKWRTLGAWTFPSLHGAMWEAIETGTNFTVFANRRNETTERYPNDLDSYILENPEVRTDHASDTP